jgi:transcriptional regulator with XRE-family HTH domain
MRWHKKVPPHFNFPKTYCKKKNRLLYCIHNVPQTENARKGDTMDTKKTFGSFITEKRLKKEITLRRFAGMLDLSPVYICNFEKDRKPAPKDDVLARIVNILMLSKEETEEMYDLAAKSKNAPTVSSDLPDYIMEKDIVRVALRTAKDVDATDEEWQEFIKRITKRSNKEQEDE